MKTPPNGLTLDSDQSFSAEAKMTKFIDLIGRIADPKECA
ncbi:Uncharacterised protein [Achromobacter sp. 2789STDY5608633]|jgi:hypothetical protein|nr:Uncharacterised protein [Achromobacter sp. 2789STDY5608633]